MVSEVGSLRLLFYDKLTGLYFLGLVVGDFMYKQIRIDNVTLYFDLEVEEDLDPSLEDIADAVEELNDSLSYCDGLKVESPQLVLSEVTEADITVKLIED
jgi:hypothetical protein